MSRIRVLPDNLINKIAAGEVIERPASVVKELIENALDAGASRIDVEARGGGKRLMRVADDGEGLDKDDALLALERHATSKLDAASDLVRIETLGFRGEALPAIASVSRLTLATSRDGRGGTRIEVEGGRIRRVEETAHPRGTTVEVRDLFHNVPARAKFLRAPGTELGHISELVASYAVASSRVRFGLTHESRRLVEAPPAESLRRRIVQVYGASWDAAIPLDAERGGFVLKGLLAPPDESSSTRRGQHLYVNGRLVRDRVVGHAVTAAFSGILPKGRHAAIFLFLTCPPDEVDVNVHPAKAEVRFRNPGLVHDLVGAALGAALRETLPVTPLTAASQAVRQGGASSAQTYRAPGPSPTPRSVSEAMSAFWEGPSPVPAAEDEPPRRDLVPLAHYKESYIVAADSTGLLLVDQHAAHERILYEQLRAANVPRQGLVRQALIFPATVGLPRSLAESSAEVVSRLEALGFSAEPFGDATVIVREVPALLGTFDVAATIKDLVERMEDEEEAEASDAVRRRDKMLATVACHAAVKVRMPLTREKMNYLINGLFRTESPLKCPHGRPAVLRFSDAEIEKGFDRR